MQTLFTIFNVNDVKGTNYLTISFTFAMMSRTASNFPDSVPTNFSSCSIVVVAEFLKIGTISTWAVWYSYTSLCIMYVNGIYMFGNIKKKNYILLWCLICLIVL